MSNTSQETIQSLNAVIQELNVAYLTLEDHSPESIQVLERLHGQRQSLAAKLQRELPMPVPKALVGQIEILQHSIDELRKSLLAIQQASCDEVFKLKSHQKAKKAYSQF